MFTEHSNNPEDFDPGPFDADDLHRQSEIWRSLLSGEKVGTDYLNLGDYVAATAHLIRHYTRMACTALAPAWVWLVAATFVSLAITAVAIYSGQGNAVIGVAAYLQKSPLPEG